MSVVFARTGKDMSCTVGVKAGRFDCWIASPFAMAPHLAAAELDVIHEKSEGGLTPIQIHKRLKAQRDKKKLETQHLANVRKALEGKRYKRGRVETRGRNPKVCRAMVLRMGAKRKELMKKTDCEREVRWEDVRRAARVPKGHRPTLKKAFGRKKIPVAARRPREKPQRTAEHEAERYAFSKEMSDKPPAWTHMTLTGLPRCSCNALAVASQCPYSALTVPSQCPHSASQCPRSALM